MKKPFHRTTQPCLFIRNVILARKIIIATKNIISTRLPYEVLIKFYISSKCASSFKLHISHGPKIVEQK